MTQTALLIIGAGPFGLSLAAYAQHLGIDYLLLGQPMGFWIENMPRGMYLRSACDWHLDPVDHATIEAYLDSIGKTTEEVEPLSLEFYLDYTQWFQKQKGIEADPTYVESLDYLPGDGSGYRATLEDGRVIGADHVAVAIGMRYFKNLPEQYTRSLPNSCLAHTCDLVDFEHLRGKNCLIIGGRQSAFEWTALLREAGAAQVHVVHRHPTPAFTTSDWSWVNPLVDHMVDDPAWFRNLSREEQDHFNGRLYEEGRLKLEPWLDERIHQDNVYLWPETQVSSCSSLPDGSLQVSLDNGESLHIHQVILATGYKVQIQQVPFFARGNILDQMTVVDGFPQLDEHLQTNLPGLFITSLPAARDFGPFFGFTIAVRTSARLIGKGLLQSQIVG